MLVAVVVAAVLAGVVVLLVNRGPGTATRTPSADGSAGAGRSSPTPSPSPSAAPIGPVKGVLFAQLAKRGRTSATYAVGVASGTGARPHTLTSVTIDQGQALFAAASPDRSNVLLADGTELDLATGRLSTPTGLVGEVARQPWVAGSDTILTLASADGGLVQPNLNTRGASTLPGSATAFAADPNFAAVFAVGTQVGDSAPALLREGQFPGASGYGTAKTLATAAKLAKMVGLPAGAAVTLGTPVVSFDGREVAVAVSGGAGAKPQTGWAVVTSSGRAVSAVPAAPARPGWAVWSAGNQLALSDAPVQKSTPRRLRLAAPPRSGSRTLPLPAQTASAALAQPCVFSPDGGTLLCGDATTWVSVNLQTGAARSHPDPPGVPLAWVSG